MSNMSYCRFENTNQDLNDCQSALEELLANGRADDKLSERELKAAKKLAATCLDIAMLLAEHAGKDIEELDEEDIRLVIDNANQEAAQNEKRERDAEEREVES